MSSTFVKRYAPSVLLVLLVASAASADDRALLRSRDEAPPNVLLLYDAGAMSTHDSIVSEVNFIAAGDDNGLMADPGFDDPEILNRALVEYYGWPALRAMYSGYGDAEILANLKRGAKVAQAKRAIRAFLNAGFQFNFGFTWLPERKGERIYHLNWIYRVLQPNDFDANGDGVFGDTPPSHLQDCTAVGMPIRMGSTENLRSSAAPFYPTRFGMTGNDPFIMWENGDTVSTTIVCDPGGRWPYYGLWTSTEPSHTAGQYRVKSYLVNNAYQQLAPPADAGRLAAHEHYYPSYDWANVPAEIQSGLTGAMTWDQVATVRGIDTNPVTNSNWEQDLRDDVQAEMETHEIGSDVLLLREDVEVYDTSVAGNWRKVSSQITPVQFVQVFVMYDHDYTEQGNPQPNTFSPMNWQGSADCVGYDATTHADCRGDGIDEMPFIPFPQPPPSDGSTVDQRWRILPSLEPQPNPVYTFPNYPGGARVMPDTNLNFIPLTQPMIAAGRRPIKNTFTMVKKYFDSIVYGPQPAFCNNNGQCDDPLCHCRSNYAILISDGTETCAGGQSVCTHASGSPVPIYTIFFGDANNANLLARTDVECIATNSGAAYFVAGDEEELIAALLQIAQDIEERTRAFASPIVPSVETTSEQIAYISTFTPFDGRSIWRGHLRAYRVDPATGTLEGLTAYGNPDPTWARWDAGDNLAHRDLASDGRNMFYGSLISGTLPGARKGFVYPSDAGERTTLASQIFGGMPVDVDGDGSIDPDTTDLKAVIDFITGKVFSDNPSTPQVEQYGRKLELYGWCDRTDQGTSQTDFTPPCPTGTTVDRLGDIFHSTPRVSGAPACFPCWFQNLHGYQTFSEDNSHRRKVLFAGADDGTIHAFDSGMWDPNGDATPEGEYDTGTGRELFAWVPQGAMHALEWLARLPVQEWTVDGTGSVGDVFVDHSFSGTPDTTDAAREWRSVVLIGMREGGRTISCLDVTQPDTYGTDHMPSRAGDLAVDPWTAAVGSPNNRDPECLATGTCSSDYPEFRWEITDNLNSDGSTGNTQQDMGETWSRPLIGFVKVGGVDRSVAFMGGGYTPNPAGLGSPPEDKAGNYVYGIDIETGKIIVKVESDGMVPADVAALDLNVDGFLEKIYWGDTNGNVYRLDVSADGVLSNTTDYEMDGTAVTVQRVSNWPVKLIFQAGTDQPFFQRPALVPISFNVDGTAVLGIALGSGDRDNLFSDNLTPYNFFVIKDDVSASDPPHTIGQLAVVHASDVNTEADFLADPAYSGWRLELVGHERVNTPAIVVTDWLLFSTFTARPVDPDTCTQGGLARTYIVMFRNGNIPADQTGRYIEYPTTTVIATEPVIYLGADGNIHIIQALDNLVLTEPIAAMAVPVRVITWKER